MDPKSYEELRQRARRALRFLLLGVDPHTAEKLSAESIVMDPDVRQALGFALEALESKDPNRRSRSPLTAKKTGFREFDRSSSGKGFQVRAGEAWSAKEDAQLATEFRQQCALSELARKHGRTRGAISARLVRLGLVTSRDQARTLLRRPGSDSKPATPGVTHAQDSRAGGRIGAQ